MCVINIQGENKKLISHAFILGKFGLITKNLTYGTRIWFPLIQSIINRDSNALLKLA